MPITAITILVLLVLFLASAIRVLNEYERGVIFRLGRLLGAKGPGLIILIPIIDRMVRVSLRLVTMDVAPQDVITRDNVSVKVNAVVYFRVMDPDKAVVEVEDYLYATSQLAQTTLRSVCGQAELDELLSEREKLNTTLADILDKHTDPWGIKVTAVEVKHIDLPVEMQRAMAKQAEAERERRAKVIHAEGEYQASTKLADAAEIISTHPMAMQLRFLQTLTEVATEKNSTIIFPVPMDLIRPFLEKVGLPKTRKEEVLKEVKGGDIHGEKGEERKGGEATGEDDR
ncbi:MAG TPA: slipin family protein [Syntrophaceae bacterium]|nr:slipin family protein [Syntrophaceae bacterium]